MTTQRLQDLKDALAILVEVIHEGGLDDSPHFNRQAALAKVANLKTEIAILEETFQDCMGEDE